MAEYHVMGIDEVIADEVRRTMRSPQYGHAAARELAAGTGPCRVCLEPFRVGEEERVLFTYRPAATPDGTGAPGPVFIHAEPCERYRGTRFPPSLHEFDVILEARASGDRVPSVRRVKGATVDDAVAEMLADPDVAWVNVRHGHAGCHITRVERGPVPAALSAAAAGG